MDEELDELAEIFDGADLDELEPVEVECYPFKPNARILLGMCQKRSCYDLPCNNPKHRKTRP